MAEENSEGVKISLLPEGHRESLETAGGYVPVAVPGNQTYRMLLSELRDPAEIFVAIYGTTTDEQVAAAVEANKTIFATRTVDGEVRIAPLSDRKNVYHFVWQASDGTREIWELASNGWTHDDLPGGIDNIYVNDTLTGSGTSEDPFGVNTETIEEIALGEAEDVVDAVRSKILYTLNLGAVTGGQAISGSNFHVKATLFNPNMNQPIDEADTNILFAVNQTESNQDSDIENKKAFLAIYRYDMTDEGPSGVANSINWVANTDNIISLLGGSSWQAGLKKVKFAHVKTDSNTGEKEVLLSNKMYYLVLISNCTGCKFVGNAKNEQLNTTPYTAFNIDNLKINGTQTLITKDTIDKDNIQTNLATLTPETEINIRMFAAITNVEIE